MPTRRGLLGWGSVLLGPFLVFGAFLVIVGVNPIETYRVMLDSALGSSYGVGEVAVRAAPYILTALATAIPARVRLVNVGGEGQFAIGALTATAVAIALGAALPQWMTLIVVALAGAGGGILWAGIAGVLRVKMALNETVSTLLLNYIAFLVVGYFVHGLLKDPGSFNWPFSPPFEDAARFPTFGNTRMHLGIFLAPIAAIVVWYLTSKTFWGLRLRVVGGNPEAARRSGINAGRIQLFAIIAGGALAGLAGMIEVSGVEGRLRPMTGVGFGYVGFLAAWMVSHHPLWLIGSSILLAIIATSGSALQISSGLPSSAVSILMALVLLGTLAGYYRKARGS